MIRREARKRALEVLYQNEITCQGLDETIEIFERVEKEVSDFTSKLVYGVAKNREDIDAKVDLAAARWTVERMPILDRNILRIAAFEIFHLEDIPISVSINEAVELAKLYGTPDSSKFINGVLGNIAKKIEEKKT